MKRNYNIDSNSRSFPLPQFDSQRMLNLKLQKEMKKRLMLCLCVFVLPLAAQNGTVAAGADLGGAGGSASATTGQIDYFTITGSGGVVTSGQQQPYEIWVITGVELPGIELSMAVYPNPATDYVVLRVEEMPTAPIRYALYNLSGQLLDSQEILQPTTQIVLSQYAMGAYLLKIFDGDDAIKTFKVIKNQ